MAELHLTGDGPLKQLVDELEELYPTVDPQPTDTWERVLYKSGQRSVVTYLKSKLED